MPHQVSKEAFIKALRELGHDPNHYDGKRLSLNAMSQLYEMNEDLIIEAVDRALIVAHYDYANDTIWVDALDAAHFYYCVCSEAAMYSTARSA